MYRSLAIVAAAALVLAAVCFAGASMLGGPELARSNGLASNGAWEGWVERRLEGWIETLENFENDGEFDSATDLQSEQVTRELAWSGGHELSFLHGGTVHFREGPERKVVVTGPARIVERFSMHDGVVADHTLPDGDVRLSRVNRAVSIEITAPDIDTFSIVGGGNATIENLDRRHVEIVVIGSSDVTMSGAVESLDISVLGSGDIDAGGVTGAAAEVEILGSGDATIAPTQSVNVNIAGSGDVVLLSAPTDVRTDINGSGELIRRQPDGAANPL